MKPRKQTTAQLGRMFRLRHLKYKKMLEDKQNKEKASTQVWKLQMMREKEALLGRVDTDE